MQASVLQGEVARAGLAQPGGEKAQGDLGNVFIRGGVEKIE